MSDALLLKSLTVMLLTMSGCRAAPLTVSVNPQTPSPGDTIKIMVPGVSAWNDLDCQFGGRAYTVFPINKREARVLIGLPADWKAGPAPLEIKEKRVFGRDRKSQVTIDVQRKEFPKENLRLTEKKTQLTQDPKHGEAKQKIEKILSRQTPHQKWKGKFDWPVKGKVTTGYGVRRTVNKSMAWPYHKGIDVYAPIGTEVVAPNDGTVVLAEAFPVQGQMIILNHGQGIMTAYLHLSAREVREGQDVSRGQLIGRVGAEGFTTGPHLHWGFYVQGEPVDPNLWMQTEF